MDINRTSGKRVRASQRDFVTARVNQATIRKPWKSLAVVAFGLLLSVPGLTQTRYNFTAIDVIINGQKATSTAANGNSTHEIAGGFDDANGNGHGFVLNKGVFSPIDAPGAVGGTAINGINAPGQLAGTYEVAGGTPHAFFDNNGYFTTIDPPGSIRSQGGFINAKGQVVGSYRTGDQKRHGFMWQDGTFSPPINFPDDHPLFGTVALGINDNGEVVGNYVDAVGNRHGFLRDRKGGFTALDVPTADFTVAQGINNAGTIVGLYFDNNGEHGFVLNDGVYTTVDVPDSNGTTAIFSINAKGEIVGSYNDADGGHGFLGIPVH